MAWTLEQLRSFVAAAEHGSFSAAARAGGRAQSVVSAHIALLEADLGVDLFRRGHMPTLTEAGALLLVEAREVLSRCRRLDERAHALCRSGVSALRIGVEEGLPFGPVMEVLGKFSEQFPHVEADVLTMPSAEANWWMTEDTLALGVFFDAPALRADGRELCCLGAVERVLATAESHPLARAGRVTHDELARYRQIVTRSGMDRHEGDAVLSPLRWYTNNYYTAADMAARGLGWTLLPVSVAPPEYVLPGLTLLRRTECRFSALNIMLVWKPHVADEKLRVWLQAELTRVLRPAL